MMARPFSIGDEVVSIRDCEMSDRATVIGYEESERGFVLVKFADGMPRALSAQSLQRPADRPEQFRPQPERTLYAQATNLGDYLRLVGEFEPEILTKEKE